MEDEDPRAGAPRKFTPKIVGGSDHLPAGSKSGKRKDRKQALARARRDDDDRVLSRNELKEIYQRMSLEDQIQISEEVRKKLAKEKEEKESETFRGTDHYRRTVQNRRLRRARSGDWLNARVETDFWLALLDFHTALQGVAAREIGALAYAYPEIGRLDRGALVKRWREALVRQMLTPAPDMAAVRWKQAILVSKRHEYTFTVEHIERTKRAIAEDIAFLAAHPTKWRSSK